MPDRPSNPKATPPSEGNWIVVDMQEHKISLFEDGKALPQPFEHFSVGQKDKAGHHWMTRTENAEIFPNRRYKTGYRSHSFKDPNNHNLGALMDYALFFNDEGQAFHAGDVKTESHGCIHLKRSDAAKLFEWVGDKKVRVRFLGPYSHQHSMRELSSVHYA
jgi:hypothetical protein